MTKVLLFIVTLACAVLAEEPALLMDENDVSWTGVPGVVYEVWYSSDLSQWNDSQLTRTGAGALSFSMSEVFPTAPPSKVFFRLRWKQFVDTDGDLMNDAWEQMLVDLDTSDGITHISHLLPAADFDQDGIKNYDEYRYGMNSQLDDKAAGSSEILYVYQLNRIQSVTVTDGSSATFAYDANANLTSAD